MKTAIFSLLFSAVLLLFGCADRSISPLEADNNSYQLIKLPPKAGLSVETVFSKTKTINGDEGGEIKIKESYVAEDGHLVKIDVKLEIVDNSFSGDVDITMTVDDVYAAVTFSPHMVFNHPVKLKMKFVGIDLEELNHNNGNYDFIYIANTGISQFVDHDQIEVSEQEGKIKMEDARLHHFSRYAFSR